MLGAATVMKNPDREKPDLRYRAEAQLRGKRVMHGHGEYRRGIMPSVTVGVHPHAHRHPRGQTTSR